MNTLLLSDLRTNKMHTLLVYVCIFYIRTLMNLNFDPNYSFFLFDDFCVKFHFCLNVYWSYPSLSPKERENIHITNCV